MRREEQSDDANMSYNDAAREIKCHIDWNTLPLAAWEEKFSQIRRSNILQSYKYARVICPIQKQKARWGLIRINGKEAGLVQILEVIPAKAGIHKSLKRVDSRLHGNDAHGTFLTFRVSPKNYDFS